MPTPKLRAVAADKSARGTRSTSPPAGVALAVAQVATVQLEALLTTDQAAAILAVAPRTLANDGSSAELGLPFIKIGSAVRYRAADLREFIDARVSRPAKVAA